MALKSQPKSYERFIQPIEDQMMRTIWRIVRTTEDAEDTLQEALVIIWKRYNRITDHPNPQALILKICTNAAYDTLRRKYRNSFFENTTEAIDNSVDENPLASSRLIDQEREQEIMKAISQLPNKQAAAVLMRIVQEMPYSEIAQALNCSESTVRIHVSRGKAHLNEILDHLLQPLESEVPA